MALWFPIMVNSNEVGLIEMVLTYPIERRPQEDEVCTYHLKYFNRTLLAVDTTIEHPYKALNPIPLLSAALTKIEDING